MRMWLVDFQGARKGDRFGMSLWAFLLVLGAIGNFVGAGMSPAWWHVPGYFISAVFLCGGLVDVPRRAVREQRKDQAYDFKHRLAASNRENDAAFIREHHAAIEQIKVDPHRYEHDALIRAKMPPAAMETRPEEPAS